jgi:hypothetical protein
VHRDEQNGVFAAHVRRVESVLSPLFGEEVQVMQEGGEGRSALEGTPRLDQVEKAVQVEPGGQPGCVAESVDLRPHAGAVQHESAQLGEIRRLGRTHQFPVEVHEASQPAASLVADAFETADVLERIHECPAERLVLVGASPELLCPLRQWGQVSKSEAEGCSGEDPRQGDPVFGSSEETQPGVEVGDLGDLEQSTE